MVFVAFFQPSELVATNCCEPDVLPLSVMNTESSDVLGPRERMCTLNVVAEPAGTLIW